MVKRVKHRATDAELTPLLDGGALRARIEHADSCATTRDAGVKGVLHACADKRLSGVPDRLRREELAADRIASRVVGLLVLKSPTEH